MKQLFCKKTEEGKHFPTHFIGSAWPNTKTRQYYKLKTENEKLQTKISHGHRCKYQQDISKSIPAIYKTKWGLSGEFKAGPAFDNDHYNSPC